MVCAFLCLVYEILFYPHVIKVSYTFFSVLKCSVFLSDLELFLCIGWHQNLLLSFPIWMSSCLSSIYWIFSPLSCTIAISANVSRSFLFFVSGVFVYRIPALLCFTYFGLIGLGFLSSTFRLVLAMSISGSLHLQICFRKVEVLFCFCWN